MISNYSGDWVDVNNYKSFYMYESIEKWLCNHTLREIWFIISLKVMSRVGYVSDTTDAGTVG